MRFDQIKWKKKMQREFRKMDCSLSYKESESPFNVFTNKERYGKSILVSYKTYEKIPQIRFDIPHSKKENQLSEKRIAVIDKILKEFLEILEMGSIDVCEVIISLETISWSQMDKEVCAKLLKEHKLVPLHENWNTVYITENLSKLETQLGEMYTSVEKKYRDHYWDKEHPLKYFGSNIDLPRDASFNFSDVIDRKAAVTIDPMKKIFSLSFSSIHHSKRLELNEIDCNTFVHEYELFLDEERFKVLFDEPKMNQTIDNYLRRAKEDLYPRVNTEDLFEFLLTHYTVEEMTQLAGEGKYRPLTKVTRTEFSDMQDYNDVRSSRKILLFTKPIWGKFLIYISVEIIKDFEDGETEEKKEKMFSLHNNFEEAEKFRKNWIRENMIVD